MILRTEARTASTPLRTLVITLLSIFGGLVALSIFFAVNGVPPLYALERIFISSFFSPFSLSATISKMIPLLLISVGLCLPFLGKFWNIGAESQLLMGALFATVLGLFVIPAAPSWVMIPVLFLGGALGGMLWGTIPALLKARLGVNEVISTLMLNYIAIELVTALISGPLRGTSQMGYPRTDTLPQAGWLDKLPRTDIHLATLIIGIAAAVLVFLAIRRSKIGYEIRVLGENPEAARYAGISKLTTALVMMAVSGGLAGIAGAAEVMAVHHRLSYPADLSAGYGFTAIIVAWIARLNPLMVIVSSFFFAGLLVGGDAVQISLKLPAQTVLVANGLLLVFLIAGDFFIRYRVRIQNKKAPNDTPPPKVGEEAQNG